MRASSNPIYKFTYKLDEVKKSFKQYTLVESDTENYLTNIIRIEKVQRPDVIKGAKNLIRIRDTTNWQKCKMTGLLKIPGYDLYYGDLKWNNQRSLLIVNLKEKDLSIILFYNYYTPKVRLIKIIADRVKDQL